MNPNPSDERAALREVVRDFLSEHATPAKVRQAIAEPNGIDRVTWGRLSGELGLVGLAVPEADGGAGAGLGELYVVLDELGRALLPSPYASTAVVAAVLAEAGAREMLPALAAGQTIGAFAFGADVRFDDGRLNGVATHVVDGPLAEVLLVPIGDDLYIVHSRSARVDAVPTLDQTRGQATVTFTDAAATRVSVSAERARQLVQVGLAVESVGAAARCLELTVEYLKTRVQFGRVIGAFQALKHRCADLAVAVESARATAYHAAAVAEAGSDELAVVAPLAKFYCTNVFMQVAAEMIQLHGGIGFTWEHEAHLYFKRAKSNQLLLGTPSQLRREVGKRAGIL
jgi:alkylation response protein AidB-like acyl-CoA dehydrogenase